MRQLTVIAALAIAWGALTGVLLPSDARAEDRNATAPNDPWSAALGGGVWVLPSYPGSDSTYAQPLPYFDVHYDPFFLVPGDGLCAYLLHAHCGVTPLSLPPALRTRR